MSGTRNRRRERRSIGLLEAATFASGVGNGIASVALPWLVLERTGSAAAAGIVAAATAVPLVLVSLFSGTVVDLVGRRLTAIVSDVLSAASVLAIPLVDAVGTLDVTALATLAVIGAVFDPAGASAREAMLPEAAGRAGWTLDRANGVHETVFGLAFLAGPGVGGLLITTVGASGALAGTGVMFLVAAAGVLLLRGLPDSGRPARATRPDGLWSGTVEGLRFVLGDPLLRPLALLVLLIVGCYYPLEGIVLPVHFTELGAPGQLSALLMAMSAGSILGTLAYEPLLRLMSRRTLLVASVLGSLLSLVWLGMLPAFAPLMVAGALSGLLWGPVQPLLNHAMQLRTPHHLRGRVTGTITSASLAAGPVGLLAGGFLIEAYGVRTAALGLALAMLAVGVAMTPLKAWRLLDAAAIPGTAAADHPVGRVEPADPRGPADGLRPAADEG